MREIIKSQIQYMMATIVTEVYMMTESIEESHQCIHFVIIDNIIEKLKNHGTANLNI